MRDGLNVDTVLAPLNPFYTNLWVDFHIRENEIFQVFDFVNELSIPGFDGRFPFFDPSHNSSDINKWFSSGPFEIKKISDQEAEIIYNMNSAGWLNLFASNTLQLHIQVVDKDLNISNKIITVSFTLNGIKE